jgi:hypothetical protein
LKIIDNPALLDQMRENTAKIKANILPEIGAKYFVDVLACHFYNAGTRPRPAWWNTAL